MIFNFHGFKTFSINFSDISENFFYKIINVLTSQHYNFSTIKNYIQSNNKTISIYFDDGKKEILHVMRNIKEKNPTFTASIFIIANTLVNHKHKFDTFKAQYLSINDLIWLNNNNFEIGSHSLTHKPLTILNDSDLKKEVFDSKKILEDIIQSQITSFSLPYSAYNQKVIDVLYEVGYEKIVINKFTNNKKILWAYPINKLENILTIESKLKNSKLLQNLNILNILLYSQFSKGSILLKKISYSL